MSLRATVVGRIGPVLLEARIDTGPGRLVVVGPNGSGKTSLLSFMLGILPVEHGRVEIGEHLLLDTERGVDVPIERRRIGYVPQGYALFPHLTVRENVEFVLGSALSSPHCARRVRRVDGILHDLGLDALAGRNVAMLSGGEKQRVALARVVAAAPRAVLLDEPLSALDAHSRPQIRAFLATQLERLRIPTVLVTHDPTDARVLGHRIAVLEAGRISQTGTWAELAGRPATRFVEEFVASAR